MYFGEGKKDENKLTRISSAIVLAVILVLSTFTLSSMTIAYDVETIRINEIMYNPAGADNGHEWIEIYNNADYAINITGWRLYEQGVNHTLSLKNGSMEIPADGFAVIADNYLNFLIDYPSYSGTLIDSSFKLSNTGEYLAIKNDVLEIIDEVTYVPQNGANNTGMTIEYKADDIWEVSLVYGGTPGAPNSEWGPPFEPTDPLPENNSENISINPTISVLVTDPDNDTMNVSFYNASDDNLIGTAANVPNGSRAEAIWSDLEYNTTYEWYAIANDSIFDNRSDTWTFTTMLQNDPPYKPSDPLPENESINIGLNPLLSVNVTDPDNDTMDVYFYNASDDTLIDVAENVQNGSRAEVNWSGLQYNTTYSWYAIANDSIFENRSDTWTFTTMLQNDPPYKPSDPLPGNNSTNVPINPTISVLVTDPDDDTMNVSFYNASDDNLIGTATNVSNGSRAEVNWSSLQYNTTYSWYAIANDSIFENRSDTWTFTTTQNRPPNQPFNPDPYSGETGVDINADLSWNCSDPDDDPLTYDVYFGTNSTPPKVASNHSDNTYDPGTMKYNTTYYWKIVAWDDYGASNTSEEWNFTTNGLPTIRLIKPKKYDEKKWGCYFRNRRICNYPIVFIIGYIDLEVEAKDNEGIEKVEFYVDNHLKANVNETDQNGIYRWTWNERIFFGHIIKVVAVDTDGNIAKYSIIVFIINFRFLSWWKT
ncbi:MAG: lamin tail domain-containing protein [Thermoplasmatales archaeon]|nr:lamin tail domain-containing protein [Thermoplasmatales archaeon]